MTKSGNGSVNDARIYFFQDIISKPQLLHRTRTVVFNYDISLLY